MPAADKTVTEMVTGYQCDGVGCTEWCRNAKDANWIKIVFVGKKGGEDGNRVSESLWFHSRACARSYQWRDLVRDVFDTVLTGK